MVIPDGPLPEPVKPKEIIYVYNEEHAIEVFREETEVGNSFELNCVKKQQRVCSGEQEIREFFRSNSVLLKEMDDETLSNTLDAVEDEIRNVCEATGGRFMLESLVCPHGHGFWHLFIDMAMGVPFVAMAWLWVKMKFKRGKVDVQGKHGKTS